MKKIVIAIIITLIIMIILISTLLIILNKTNREYEKGDIGETIDYSEVKSGPVTDNIDFFTIRNCVQTYLDRININSSTYDDGEERIDNLSIATNIYDLLSTEYIQKNSITTNNLLQKINIVEEKLIFVPLKMNYLELENTSRYAVYGFYQNLNNQYIKDVYFIVNVDKINQTFSVMPIQSEQNLSIEKIQLNKENIEIKPNDNNSYIVQKITDQYLCEQYFLIQKRLMLAKPEQSYYYLDEEYRTKRFKTIEDYKNYINENQKHIVRMSIKSYEVKRENDFTQYTCKDQYDNYYIFNVKEVLNYTVRLDAYTVETKEIEEAYMKYSNQRKVSYNINKWFQMLNNRDYENAYYLLNETFRNSNWNSIEDFKTYMKQNYPSYYQIEYNQFQTYGNNYAQVVLVKDIEKKNQNQRNITIIMRLKENMNFEMSFNI